MKTIYMLSLLRVAGGAAGRTGANTAIATAGRWWKVIDAHNSVKLGAGSHGCRPTDNQENV